MKERTDGALSRLAQATPWRQINGPLQTGLSATDISCRVDSLCAMAVDFGD